ncbi:chromate resistance protein [Halomonas cupida]|uniref:chromate resistance protein ChrB domain-containing protein n=1 Tax=Halomonas cupida TaxID=44933 RepID=UPI0039B41200
MIWILLILSLPTENATVRMRAWRSIKALGAASLRDGVYLLPASPDHVEKLEAIARDVREAKGVAHVLPTDSPEDDAFSALFDRSDDYEALHSSITELRATLLPESAMAVMKETRKLRKRFTRLSQIDFFPGAARDRVDRALQELETNANRVLSPDEPLPASGPIHLLEHADYQGRTWATRRRPWVDRLASAWLIERFIDPKAHFLWLSSPADCPDDALGFDFDGATFTHMAEKVTFETLLASFDLRQVALQRIGELVHYLDVGGHQPPEASGVECVLMGLRETHNDDDQLLLAANQVFDSLYTTYTKGK